jgi:alkylation response protein AidB-like acyl-CoA dehydrogenase
MLDQHFYEQIAFNSLQIEPANDWPTNQLQLCRNAKVFSLLSPGSDGSIKFEEFNGVLGREESLARDWLSLSTYIEIAKRCLATAFVLTQRQAAVVRIAASSNALAKERWLPKLFSGELFSTVGISHLTTSRQHLKTPVLAATLSNDGSQFEISGYSPWVTGAAYADLIVVGATLDDGRQVLLAVDSKLPGVKPLPGMDLMALSASKTDQVHFDRVVVDNADLLLGPSTNVMRLGSGGGTGSLQTSALAIGLSLRAVDYLLAESANRPDLGEPVEQLQRESQALLKDLHDLVHQSSRVDSLLNSEQIRQRANSLALRSTQSTLMVAKGAGYMCGHPAERWCREALFFLVWSCPKSVSFANLCEFAKS